MKKSFGPKLGKKKNVRENLDRKFFGIDFFDKKISKKSTIFSTICFPIFIRGVLLVVLFTGSDLMVMIRR